MIQVKSAWYERYRKFLVALLFAVIEVANAWADGPEWLHAAAPMVAAVLVMLVPNAPEYRDPRK